MTISGFFLNFLLFYLTFGEFYYTNITALWCVGGTVTKLGKGSAALLLFPFSSSKLFPGASQLGPS